MKTLLRLSIAAAFVSQFVYAEPSDIDGFAHAYEQYNIAVNSNNNQDIINYAQQSYELGQIKFGKDSLDSAKLAMNWANVLIDESKRNNNGRIIKDAATMQALSLFDSALSVYRNNVAENDITLIDPLLGLAQTTTDDKFAKKLLFEAIDIAEKADNALTVAEVKLVAFHRLSGTEFYTRKVRDFLIDANDIYVAKLPENSIERVNSTYLVGALYSAMNKPDAAPLLLEVIKQYQALPYSHPYELRAHALLVNIYAQQDQADKATEHCVAIGKMTPWNDQQEQTPLYRKAPDYPMSYAKRRKNGWVQIEFTVDENGFVKSPEIIDSQGGSKFEKESIEALSQWRYAPKFVDGKPTEAKSMVRLDFTIS
ncbi:energy transducer TonB [Shewanella sp. MEBiC00475]|uniref:energy transducer TonB n=1 Tax=Shewanella sp. MEBiC00475 TaxID=2575361 RepID=UPI0010BFD6D0|nr:energy transducer TonB [Shewanella sp. MEBiC00475]